MCSHHTLTAQHEEGPAVGWYCRGNTHRHVPPLPPPSVTEVKPCETAHVQEASQAEMTALIRYPLWRAAAPLILRE